MLLKCIIHTLMSIAELNYFTIKPIVSNVKVDCQIALSNVKVTKTLRTFVTSLAKPRQH